MSRVRVSTLRDGARALHDTRAPATHQRGAGPRQEAMRLQQTAGNQLVQRLLRGDTGDLPLPGSHPSDAHEQEAERLARVAVRAPGSAAETAERPLPDGLQAFFASHFGAGLGGVRLHTDGAAARAARAVGARAFTLGQDIYLGAGTYAPHTIEGRRLLAHELVHVVQQLGGAVPAGAPIQLDALPTTIVISLGPQDPLARYDGLRQALDAETWAKLNNAARARDLRQQARTGGAIDTAQRDRFARGELPEAEVPLYRLLRPAPALVCLKTGYRERLFQMATAAAPDAVMMSTVVQGEIVDRWVEANSALVNGMVRVALIDPQGTAEGEAGLTFQVQGQPVPTRDGGLYIAQVDQVGARTLPAIQEPVSAGVHEVEQAANLALTAKAAIRKGREMITTGHRAFSADDVTRWGVVLRELQGRINGFVQQHQAVGGLLSGASTEFAGFVAGEAGPFELAHAEFLKQNMPSLSFGERSAQQTSNLLDRQEQAMKEGGFFSYVAAGEFGRAAGWSAASQGMANIVTFNYVETSRQFHQAFREGHISLAAFEEGLENAATRSLIVGGITLALTIATFGLAGPVLGTSATLGQQVLYWGGTAAVTTMAGMTAESLYTRSTPLADPYAQQIWQQGAHTPLQILGAGALSFGMGASGPLMGWLGNRANAQAARALVTASAEGRALTTPLGSGLTHRVISPGVVEITQAGQPGLLRLTSEGWQLIMPAGKGQAPVMAGVWGTPQLGPVAPELLQRAPSLAGLRDVAAVSWAGEPFAVGVTGEGWFFYAPRAGGPVTTGGWGVPGVTGAGGSPLMLPPGPGGMVGSGAPLLPGGSPTPLLPPFTGGPVIADIQAGALVDLTTGRPGFLPSTVAGIPGARGIGIEAGDWMLGYPNIYGVYPTHRGDLDLARQMARTMPMWPNVPPGTPLSGLPALQPWQQSPGPYLFPQTGPVTVLPQPFFPAVGGQVVPHAQLQRLLPRNLADVTRLEPSAHPTMYGAADRIYWRRPFGLGIADERTAHAMGQELSRWLRPDGYIEFRLLRPGERTQVMQIASQIPRAEVVEVNRTAIDYFLREGRPPPRLSPTQQAILTEAGPDIRGDFGALGEGTFARIIRIYRRP